jgi:hypothetical protein
MAKIYIKPNPNVNPLAAFVRLEQKRTIADRESSIETTEVENISPRYTRAPGTSYRICANPSEKLHGNLNHGMSHEIPNPYKDHTTFYDDKFRAVLEGKDKAPVQHILEFKYNKPFNYFTNQVADAFTTPHNELPILMRGDYTLELEDGTTVLDTDTEFGEVMSYIVRANSKIANSFEEITSFTPFYIAHEAEEAKIKQQREAIADRAIAKLVSIFDSPQKPDLLKFVKALDLPKRPTSPETAYNELKQFIVRSGENAKLFIQIYEMYTEEATRNVFEARVLLADARQYAFITRDGATYTWHRPNSEEGIPQKPLTFSKYTGENSIIEFLSSKQYLNEQAELKQQIARASR